jgi:hypothetical protein
MTAWSLEDGLLALLHLQQQQLRQQLGCCYRQHQHQHCRRQHQQQP